MGRVVAAVILDQARGLDDLHHLGIDLAGVETLPRNVVQLPVTAGHAKTSRRIGPGFPSRLPARKVSANRFCDRSEEHTSELQSLMRISYAVFCLKKKKKKKTTNIVK